MIQTRPKMVQVEAFGKPSKAARNQAFSISNFKTILIAPVTPASSPSLLFLVLPWPRFSHQAWNVLFH